MHRYRLYLNCEEDKEIVKLSSTLKRLPDINYLYFEYVKPKDINVLTFLYNVAPLKLEKFLLGGECNRKSISELLRVDFYLEAISNVLKATTKEAEFFDCNITSHELRQMFIAASHLEKLAFNNCKLDIDEDFDIKEDCEIKNQIFYIKTIELCDCGNVTASDWNAYPKRLNRLVKAIANSGMKNSIEKIYMNDSALNEKKIKDIFERNKMSNVLDI